jgi:hypothetical protein
MQKSADGEVVDMDRYEGSDHPEDHDGEADEFSPGPDANDPWDIGIAPESDHGGAPDLDDDLMVDQNPPGPARLLVSAVGGGEVAVSGWLTPARIVHATKSENVVVGNDCTLETTEHHHLDRVVVSLEGIFESPRVLAAIDNLRSKGYTPALDAAFKRALRDTLVERGHDPGTLDTPLAPEHVNVTTRSGVVMVGEGSHFETETPVFVRETVLPVAELLYGDVGLRRAFVETLREPGFPGPATAHFLVGLMQAANDVDDLHLLDFAGATGVYDAAVFGLFGFTRVSNAGVVLAGAGNSVVRGVEVDVREFEAEDFSRALTELHADVDEELPPHRQSHPDMSRVLPWARRRHRIYSTDTTAPSPESLPSPEPEILDSKGIDCPDPDHDPGLPGM